MKIKTMEAAIFVAQNQPLVVDTVELPAELGVGQVLVQVHVSGICGSQLGEIAGVKGPDRFCPTSWAMKAVPPCWRWAQV